jgi:Rrf2 family protein
MIKFCNISEASSIAIHGMVLLARSDKPLNVTQIADAIGSSKHHVAKVFQRMVKFGFARSQRGPTGGFAIIGEPREISMLNIYEAIEGKIEIPEECPFGKNICTFDNCIFDNFIKQNMLDFKAFMSGKTLDLYLEEGQSPDLSKH